MCSASRMIIRERLRQIQESVFYIEQWSRGIHSADDFLRSMESVMIFNACVMRLQVIGEQVGKLLKAGFPPLDDYPRIHWQAIYGLRNIISHEYSNIDEQIVYSVITDDLPALSEAVKAMLDNIPEDL